MKKLMIFFVLSFSLNLLFSDFDFSQRVADQLNYVKSKQSHFSNWQSYEQRDTRDMESYDVIYGKIDIEIDFDEELIFGDNILEIEIVEDNVDQIILDFTNNLTIDAILANEVSLNFTHTNHQITIDLDSVYQSGERIELNFVYHGHPVEPGRYGWGFVFDEHAGEPIAFTMVEPFASRDWWPCKDVPSDKIDEMDIWITCPEDYLVASNGLLEDTIDNEDLTKTFQWHVSHPISTYLVSIAVTNYELYSIDYTLNEQSMKIDNYLFPEQYDEGVALFDQTPTMISFLSSVYSEYPFLDEKYGHAVYPGSGAMEHQTCTSFGSDHIGVEDSYTVLHELAHQWVGDLITCEDWSHIWLNEGFAVYSEVLWTQFMFGDPGYHQHIDQLDLGNLIDDKLERDESDNGSYILDIVVYYKGAWTLHMLRNIVGYETLMEIFHTYTLSEEFRYKTATTEDFKQVCEDVSGIELDWFFDEWYYHPGRPFYDYTCYYSEDSENMVVATKSSGSAGYPFSMQVPLTVNGVQHQLFIEDGLNHHNFSCEQSDNSIVWDEENWVLDYGYQHHIPNLHEIEQPRNSVVYLEWDEFFDTDISGFNVYRSEDGENYYKMNDNPIDGLHYQDENVEESVTYYYKIAAIYSQNQDDYISDFSNTIETSPIQYSFDQGILLVDQTMDYPESSPFPNDEDVDNLYNTLTEYYPVTNWDISDSGVPSLSDLAKYSTLIWHCDAISGVPFQESSYAINAYIQAGGNIILSGWKTLDSTDQHCLAECFGVEDVTYNGISDFSSANSEVFSQIEIDPDKIPMPNWMESIAYVNKFSVSESSEIIFTYDSVNDDPDWEDKPCAVKQNNHVLFGFPLYYMQLDQVQACLQQILDEFGEVAAYQESILPPSIISISNYPNPFNPYTSIRLQTDHYEPNQVFSLKICNVKGQLVKTILENEPIKPLITTSWNGLNNKSEAVTSGIYFLKYESKNYNQIKKIMLIK